MNNLSNIPAILSASLAVISYRQFSAQVGRIPKNNTDSSNSRSIGLHNRIQGVQRVLQTAIFLGGMAGEPRVVNMHLLKAQFAKHVVYCGGDLQSFYSCESW